MYDIEAIIQDIILPDVEDLRFHKPLQELMSIGTKDKEKYSGGSIRKVIKTDGTSTARNYTRSDVDPQSGSVEHVVAEWDLIYSEGAGEAHGIDLSQAEGKGLQAVENVLREAVDDAYADLFDLMYDNCYSQIRADLLNSGTYSDASLNRTTYPVLGVYNETNNTEITVAHLQAAQFQSRFNKKVAGPVGEYTYVLEPTVNYKIQPKIGALNTWQQNNSGAKPVDGGYAPAATFQGSPVKEIGAMTVGDVMYVHRKKVHFYMHRGLVAKVVPSGKDSVKVILRCGLNAYAMPHGALLIDKD